MSRRPTLTRDLLAWVLGALVLVWATFIVVGYRIGQHEADELTDGHLAGVASTLLAYSGGEFEPGAAVRPPADPQLKAHDYQQSMSVAVWDAGGRLVTRSGAAPLPPFTAEDGFATLLLGEPPHSWRVFSRWNAGHDRKLMVLLSQQERDDLADDIAEQVTEPGLWLLPVVALVLGLAIQRGLRPLYDLARDVHALDIHKGQPLTSPARHEELRDVVRAINTLVERYHAALLRERALANEFAHELRTPLASLALQARALREAPPGPAVTLLDRIEHDALRAGEVLSHLLALARASRAELDEAAQPVDLRAIARHVVAELAPAADAGGHELALAEDGSFEVSGHPVLLELALRNLVDNALGHTPRGTQVEVQLDAGARWLQVCDFPPADSTAAPAGAAVGLGLGHRVVEKIAAIHAARFDALANPAGAGRCYRIRFGAAMAKPDHE